jgi:hypothetical protein
MKRLIFWVLLFLFAGLAQAEEKRYSIPIGDSPSIGPANATVTIIEFIDFQ